MPWYSWSRTAATNSGADVNINWAEGQAPSSVNDSARAMMAETAKWRDDISGATVTAGSAGNYSLSTFSNFTSTGVLANQMIAFTPHATNTVTPVTMSVDSAAANIPVRSSPNVELPIGTLIKGTPYVVVYNQTDGVLYLQGFYGNPYNVPIAAGMDYWSNVAPNSSFAFPMGQAISRTTYATLWGLIGVAYGAGDGSTTFNLPNKQGRVSAMIEASPALLTSTYFGGSSNVLNGQGGGESHQLLATETPNIASSGAISVFPNGNGSLSVPSATIGISNASVASSSGTSLIPQSGAGWTAVTTFSGTNTMASTNTGSAGNGTGSAAAHRTVQPTIICNYIMRII